MSRAEANARSAAQCSPRDFERYLEDCVLARCKTAPNSGIASTVVAADRQMSESPNVNRTTLLKCAYGRLGQMLAMSARTHDAVSAALADKLEYDRSCGTGS